MPLPAPRIAPSSVPVRDVLVDVPGQPPALTLPAARILLRLLTMQAASVEARAEAHDQI